jgi:uncharacterized Ntn-hydrolase superfamily protein
MPMFAIALIAVLAPAPATSDASPWQGPVRDRSGVTDVERGTFSVVAADAATGEVGVAVQSKYFAVGTVVPWARAGVGAVATQAAGVAAYGPQVLDALASGLSPEKALEKVLAADPEKETRQLGVVDAKGNVASFTGAKCNAWAGGVKGAGFTAQGNILVSEAVVKEMARAYTETKGTMAERLVAALEAGQAAGGDSRGQQSAALVVERVGASKESREGIDRVVDLRVDDHVEPIKELRRLLDIQMRWSILRDASRHYRAKEYAKGVELLAAGVARFGEDATLLYDLACYESLAGRRDDALAHLARSLDLQPSYRTMARGDADFTSLRDDPDFKALVAP